MEFYTKVVGVTFNNEVKIQKTGNALLRSYRERVISMKVQ